VPNFLPDISIILVTPITKNHSDLGFLSRASLLMVRFPISSDSDSAALAPLLAILCPICSSLAGIADLAERRPYGTGNLAERPKSSGTWRLRVSVDKEPVTGKGDLGRLRDWKISAGLGSRDQRAPRPDAGTAGMRTSPTLRG
jgi:hypothetical protein